MKRKSRGSIANETISTNIECPRTISCFETFLISGRIITCSDLAKEFTIETSEWRLWRRFDVSIVDFEHGSGVDFEQVNVDEDIILRPFN